MTRVKSKKLLSIFMTICLVFTLLPMNSLRVLASETETNEYSGRGEGAKAASGSAITMATSGDEELYDVWVGGERITSQNIESVTGPGIRSIEGKDGKVEYNPVQHTLTLKDVIITEAYAVEGVVLAGIFSAEPLNIILTGKNIIQIDYFDFGIYAEGQLNISGEGELDIEYANSIAGIYTLGGDVSIDGGKIAISSKAGISTSHNFILNNGDVSINIETSQNDVDLVGIHCSNANIKGGTLNVTGNATSYQGTDVYGLIASNSVNILQGANSVNIDIESTSNGSTKTFGIYAEAGNVEISDGAVSVTVKSTATNSYAQIFGFAVAKNTIITGGTVTVKSYGNVATTNAVFSRGYVKFIDGITIAGTDSEGSMPVNLDQDTEYRFEENILADYKYTIL